MNTFIRIDALFALALLLQIASLADAAAPTGWVLSGSNPDSYEVGTEALEDGGTVAYLRALEESPTGFGTLMQTISADGHRGQRIRMSGSVRYENVSNWAGMWMRVDGSDKTPLKFDNMRDRPIIGSGDWKRYDVVLDVPGESLAISFGILLFGGGELWLDKLQFEEVDESIAVTNERKPLPTKPANLDFEQ
jgi:hypothetical protein